MKRFFEIENIIRQLQEEADEGNISSLEDLNELATELRGKYNQQPVDCFEGLSPLLMNHLVWAFLNGGRLITLCTGFRDEVAFTSPFLKICRHILQAIPEDKPLQLTATGSLPRWLVHEVYDSGVYPDPDFLLGSKSIRKEFDWQVIHLARVMCELAGLARQGKGKQKGKWILTRKGKSKLQFPSEMLAELTGTFYTNFAWDYLDFYPSENAARLGFGFTLFLLIKYGDEMRDVSFYAEKFSTAFPIVLEDFDYPRVGTAQELFEACYVHRTFSSFLHPFGLVEMKSSGARFSEEYKKEVAITPLFKELVLLNPFYLDNCAEGMSGCGFDEDKDDENDGFLDEKFLDSFMQNAVDRFGENAISSIDDPFFKPVKVDQVPGRNDPCPCGSGRKYKKCCLQ